MLPSYEAILVDVLLAVGFERVNSIYLNLKQHTVRKFV